MVDTAENRSTLRTLDRCFGEWYIEHFAHARDNADQQQLLRIAQATSHAVFLKHTCVDLGIYPALSEPVLDALLAGITPQDVQRLVPEQARQPLVRSADGQRVWLQKYHGFEWAVATSLQALRTQGRLDIITGGPGTGKTWTAAHRIQQTLEKNLACRILLAAPTGKAANNMMVALGNAGFAADAYGLKGLTLHSLLGMHGNSPKPRRDRRQPLVCDLLIVDEASMVDLPMMYRLLEAIPPQASLLLLGDKDQLASVEAGSVLGEICKAFAHTPSVTTLLKSRRYEHSPEIGALAEALNRGDVCDMRNNIAVKSHRLDAAHPWQPGWLPAALAAIAAVPQQEGVSVADVLRAQKNFQILCALREGPQGVNGINAMIEKSLGKKTGSWYAGRPVMITQNDHDRHLYNGDVGMVLPVAADGATLADRGDLKACFIVNGQVRTISLAQMPAHETSYAVTIHKSQGSEYDHVLIVLPADVNAVRDNPVLTRELVYTAVTRARSTIDLWGGEGVLEAVAKKTTQRMSGLNTFLC
ncbi:MAG TPA: exodeoxyribonuclease V subunit alpha [Pseudomonadales bacterium]|nr:exodeoxyribonuclease V subunit alpha [Pseudomonadales bacterium]